MSQTINAYTLCSAIFYAEDMIIVKKVTQPDFKVKNLTQKTFKLQLSVKIFTTGKNFT